MPQAVKSSGYKSHASLDAFCKKFPARVGERFLVHIADLYLKRTVKEMMTELETIYGTEVPLEKQIEEAKSHLQRLLERKKEEDDKGKV